MHDGAMLGMNRNLCGYNHTIVGLTHKLSCKCMPCSNQVYWHECNMGTARTEAPVHILVKKKKRKSVSWRIGQKSYNFRTIIQKYYTKRPHLFGKCILVKCFPTESFNLMLRLFLKRLSSIWNILYEHILQQKILQNKI